MILTLREDLDPGAFHHAWERLIARHEVFRTSFAWECPPPPLQVVHESAGLPWEYIDLSGLPDALRESRLSDYLRQDRYRGFDPKVAPLVRCALFRTGETEWQFVWTFHHMLADGQTYPRLIREAFRHYEAAREGKEIPASDLPAPRRHREFIEWRQEHRERIAGAAQTYWQDLLKGFSTVTPLPETATPRKPEETNYGELSLRMSEAATAALLTSRKPTASR